MEYLQKEFIPYDRALRIKALGFDEPCFAFYICKGHPVMIDEIRNGKCFDSDESEGCLAPTFSRAFRWFREKCYYLSYVCAPYKEYNEFYFRIRHIGDVLNEGELESCESKVYKTYEEAELACLDKLLEIVESKSE